MKIERLIGIITILLQKEKITSPELAKRFEVTSRTIQRDVDDLCKAGIPIISVQGYGGGLSIASGYKLDKTVLTRKELEAIFIGLKSIDSISKKGHSQSLIEKFSDGKNIVFSEHHNILIDLASWYYDSLTDKIELIKEAISRREEITFMYYSNKGETKRVIAPYFILFKWSAWYVFGFCLLKNDYRLFKLNRLWNLDHTGNPYEPQEIPAEKLDVERFCQTEEIKLKAIFSMSEKYRLIEEYGMDSFTVTEDEKLLFLRDFANPDYLLQWILSFGDKVKVVEPPELVTKVKEHATKILDHYQ